MRYIQLGKFDANHLPHEVQRALDAWLAASGGLHMAVILPEYRRSGLLNRGPTFGNLDVVAQAGDPEGPVEGLGPAKTAGAGWLDRGSNGA
jgi:hypothetical protein